MELSKTEKLLAESRENGVFDGYGLYIHLGDEYKFISSPGFTLDTYVDVASMGKVLVTSTLILQAIDEGLVTLDDTLPKFFENVPEDKKNITVKSLLDHTSGILRYQFPDVPIPMPHADATEFILNSKLGFKMGEKVAYSCNGYILLGFIAEKVFGKPLDTLMQERICKPLGLTRSRFCIPPDEKDVLTCCRWVDTSNNRVDDENAYILGGVAGNGASFWTCRDIVTYCEAVLRKDEKLYSKALFDMAESDYTPGLEVGRGLGYLYVDERYKQTGKLFPSGSFGHCGHCGHSFFINRQKDMFVIILTNATRALNRASGFNGYDYGKVMKMREQIHNSIYDDITAAN